jgi:nucleolar protein 56
MVKLAAEYHFETAEEALENLTSISLNKVSPKLKAFLQTHLPATKSAKAQKYTLGISDPKMGQE